MKDAKGLRFSFAGTAFLNRYADLLDPLSLTPGRVLALSFVHEHPNCDQKTLARGLAINEASAMALIDRLQKLAFVSRRKGRDRRSNALRITVKGEAAFASALSLEVQLTDDLLGWMGKEALGRFLETLDEVRRRGTQHNQQSPPPTPPRRRQ